MEAARLGGPALASNIALARRVLADENDRETRRHAERNERARLFSDLRKGFVSDRRAIKHKGGCVGHGSSSRRLADEALLRPEDEARFMARLLSRFEHPHAGLLEQIAGETVGIAATGPRLEAEERRAWPRPQPDVLKALIFHHDRRPRRVDESERPALAIEEAERVAFKQGIGERQIAAAKGDRACGRADKSPWRELRNLWAFRFFELNQRAL